MGTAPNIVGVSGYMRTGKDSVARLLQEFGYEKVSFADPLRKMAVDINPSIAISRRGWRKLFAPFDVVLYSDLVSTVGYENAKEIPDFRRFLQRLGTEGIRGNFGEDAWVDLAVKNIKRLPAGTRVVLPDVRFPNEAEAIKDLGGVVWRTERPGYNGGPHPSEAMVAKIIPDVILRADALLDQWIGSGEFIPGLGTLVLEQIGEDPDEHRGLLNSWAVSILSA